MESDNIIRKKDYDEFITEMERYIKIIIREKGLMIERIETKCDNPVLKEMMYDLKQNL